jgi:hypothetical protein
MEPKLYAIVHKLHANLNPNFASCSDLQEMMRGKCPDSASLLFVLADAVMNGGLTPAELKNLAMRIVHMDQTKDVAPQLVYGGCWFED